MVQKKSKVGLPPAEEGSGRTRGRPRQYDPEQALAKAAEAFWKQGYAATSLDDLVAATGMNRPSLYAAFGDKRDLYLKTLTRYQQQSRAIGAQITADDPPLRVFLKRFYEAALAIYLESGDEARGCYSISTAPAQAVTDAAVRDFLAASISGTDAFVAKQIAKARERGVGSAGARPTRHGGIAHDRRACARGRPTQATKSCRCRRDRCDLWAAKIVTQRSSDFANRAHFD
jgi:TetR/AcrR family transcriptional regulator, copper-responsive repressor